MSDTPLSGAATGLDPLASAASNRATTTERRTTTTTTTTRTVKSSDDFLPSGLNSAVEMEQTRSESRSGAAPGAEQQQQQQQQQQTSSQQSQSRQQQTSSSTTTSSARLANLESGLQSPLVLDTDEGRLLKLRFDVAQYSPDEIVVKTIDNRLTVHAKHEEKSENRSVYREYNREFQLPDGIDVERIKSSLSQEGVLTIDCPLPAPQSLGASRQIPIERV